MTKPPQKYVAVQERTLTRIVRGKVVCGDKLCENCRVLDTPRVHGDLHECLLFIVSLSVDAEGSVYRSPACLDAERMTALLGES